MLILARKVQCLFFFYDLFILQLMMVVDYGGFMFPIITHSPWNGLQLADFVMPFFLFVAGVSLALVYKVLSHTLPYLENMTI